MTRRIPLSRRSHITGWHPVRPGHGAVPFESALERDAITWLTHWCGFQRVVAQPITLEYLRADGRLVHYTPDLLATFDPLPVALGALGFGTETYIEVKYVAQAEQITERLTLLGEVVHHQTDRPWVLLTEREVRRAGRPHLHWGWPMSVAPLPVAPRPFPDETLRSWADRVGAWYELSGTELVNALRTAAYPLGDTGFISLEDGEHEGITPSWATELLADAARLPRARVQAMTQDDYARWIPPSTLWNVLATYWPRRCVHCVAACGAVHERRTWRAGWVSGCPEHGIVLGTRDQPPSLYAVQLETALQEAILQGNGWVCLPWPVAGQPLCLPLSLALETLAVLAEYLCDEGETLADLNPRRGNPQRNRDEPPITVTRLIDVAAYAAGALADILVSDSHRGVRGSYCRSGLSGSQHHGLMAGLGWLLSNWPDHLIGLLWWAKLDSPLIGAALQPYLASGEQNFAMLQAHAAKIAWPLWREVAVSSGTTP